MKTTAEYAQIAEERDNINKRILNSKSQKKVIVAGPGTGKTFLFKKFLNGKRNSLTLSFVKSLVNDLSLELYGKSDVKTLHGFGSSTLSRIVGKEVNIYPKLSSIIREDLKFFNGSDIDFNRIFNNREDSNENLVYYETRRQFYDYYGFTDVIYSTVKLLEADKSLIPTYDQILIDEFQDFNRLEVTLIDILSEQSPILIVGDDDQALYETLKHASASFIRERYSESMPQYESFTLPFCARCPRVVVETVDDLLNSARKVELLKKRIDKPYLYFENEQKDKVSELFPKIGYYSCQAKQIPWIIEKCIKSVAKDIRGQFDVLIIATNNPQVKSISNALKNKGFTNIDFTEKTNDKYNSLFEGFKLIIDDKESNLGWRIVSSILMSPDTFASYLRTSHNDPSIKFYTILPSDFSDKILKLTKALKSIINNKIPTNEVLKELFELFNIDPEALSLDHLRNKLFELDLPQANSGLNNIPIKVKTIQSSKGLAADVVIITYFDDRYYIKDSGNISDQDVCNFLVALTRTKKKAFFISSVRNEVPTFLKWISKENIEHLY